MRNIKLTLQYDGSRFHGFQRQLGDIRTVQSELERVLGIITKTDVKITGAGRTDAGVHARGQVAAFRGESTIPVERVPLAINGFFEQDLVCLSAEEVPASFHPQRDAIAKAYSYTIDNSPQPSPFLRLYAAHIPEPLDVAAMQAAAATLTGRHDFKSFQAAGSSAKTSERTLTRLTVEPVTLAGRALVVITAEADGFLYHMVRNLAGTLLEIGKGRLPPEEAAAILAAVDRRVAPATAPAQGLCLEWVRY
jgi:tRNA pseudouridine38-40 synthase